MDSAGQFWYNHIQESEVTMNMILSNSALSWAATRSGMPFGEFLASLTPEREAQLLQEYNEWRTSKGLKPVAVPAMEERPVVAAEAPHKAKKDDTDDISAMIESIADEIEEEDIQEAEEISRTLEEIDAMVVEEVPAQVGEDALRDEAASEGDDAADAFEESEAIETPEAPEMPAEPEVPAAPEAPAGAQDVPVAQLFARLPKAPDPALYAALLERFSGVEAAMEAVKAAIADHTRRHRGTAALRAFLKHLEEI